MAPCWRTTSFRWQAVGLLDLQGSYAGGDATCQNPRMEEAALRVEFEEELFELRVVVGLGHWVYSDVAGLATSGTMIALDGGLGQGRGRGVAYVRRGGGAK